MSSDFKDLQSTWERNKENIESPTANFDSLYKKIKSKEKENYFFYYGTITILLVTLIVISLFFYTIAPVKESLSQIGVGLMIGGLLFRIIIEMISIHKAKHINVMDSSLETAENAMEFHEFRKKIHQVIAPVVIALYTIGFFMITPEFSIYMPFWNIVLIDVSYIVIGVILFFVIRKGVRKEMQKLAEIIALKNEIME